MCNVHFHGETIKIYLVIESRQYVDLSKKTTVPQTPKYCGLIITFLIAILGVYPFFKHIHVSLHGATVPFQHPMVMPVMQPIRAANVLSDAWDALKPQLEYQVRMGIPWNT